MDTDTTNYDMPHEVTHESKFYNDSERRRFGVTAFLCVYVIGRHYGGPEEGGWWYDAFEFTGAAFPFQAEQEYEAQEVDADNDDLERLQNWYDEDTQKWMAWVPVGLPHVTDEPTRVRLQSARMHLESIYGKPGTTHRGSMRPRGEDYTFVYELTPGDFGNRPRPRYC